MGWKSRTVFLTIVYFSGFATAIYWLVPGENDGEVSFAGTSFGAISQNSDGLARDIKTKMDLGMKFAKEAFAKANELIKQKINERQQVHKKT